jgi:hypothetical protein
MSRAEDRTCLNSCGTSCTTELERKLAAKRKKENTTRKVKQMTPKQAIHVKQLAKPKATPPLKKQKQVTPAVTLTAPEVRPVWANEKPGESFRDGVEFAVSEIMNNKKIMSMQTGSHLRNALINLLQGQK